ncbi:VanZ family protein [Lacticaseibacillus saniviri]
MIFLGPLYQWVVAHFSERINHFPLIRLVMYSLDKTILYLLFFLGIRLVYNALTHKKTRWQQEVKVAIFAGYIILLLALTVFRHAYYPWQLHFYFDRPLSAINTQPFIETIKLSAGRSQFDFWYQSLGNIGWFVPFGFGLPWISQHRRSGLAVVFWGIVLSLGIETMQFLLISGIADIDDVIFNTLGALVGWLLYRVTHLIVKK